MCPVAKRHLVGNSFEPHARIINGATSNVSESLLSFDVVASIRRFHSITVSCFHWSTVVVCIQGTIKNPVVDMPNQYISCFHVKVDEVVSIQGSYTRESTCTVTGMILVCQKNVIIVELTPADARDYNEMLPPFHEIRDSSSHMACQDRICAR